MTLASPDPFSSFSSNNSFELFENSISTTKVNSSKRFAVDEQGTVHQFTYSNDGTYHWAGIINKSEYSAKLPNKVRIDLGVKAK